MYIFHSKLKKNGSFIFNLKYIKTYILIPGFFRHIQELDCIARRMEEVKAQYAQDKENYRIQLVSSLLAAKKNQEQERLQQQQVNSIKVIVGNFVRAM